MTRVTYSSDDEIPCTRLIKQVKPFTSIKQRPSKIGEKVVVNDILYPITLVVTLI